MSRHTAPADVEQLAERVTAPLVELRDLTITMSGNPSRVVVDRMSLVINSGESLGLVGESGSGKSMTARSILRILPTGATVDGVVSFGGRSVYDMNASQLRELRIGGAAMIFQDPGAHINPVHKIGSFLTEALRTTAGVSKDDAWRRAIEKLDEVRIQRGDEIMHRYPHELSGGMLQRVMIASALLTQPKLILADEPTTALDMTTQAEVMAILHDLRQEYGLAMLFITHDLELAAATCDRTMVMYAGTAVEEQRSSSLHEHPHHPYTAALLAARPRLDARLSRLSTISGRAVAAYDAPPGCPFSPRCRYVQSQCEASRPEMRQWGDGTVRCHRAEELNAELEAAVDAEEPV